jgi:TonB family protein
VVHDWQQRLQQADEELRAANWKKGKSIADSLVRDMRERITGGEATASFLAAGLLLRAIGRAGLGETAAAAWDFGAAQSFNPTYSTVDLGPYGTAGSVLEAWRYEEAGPPAHVRQAGTVASAGEEGKFTPPRRISGAAPDYPNAKSRSCVQSAVVVHTVINEQGRPERPFVRPDIDPVLALAALDAVWTWRFEPAERDGKPVPVPFVLSIDFKVGRCS